MYFTNILSELTYVPGTALSNLQILTYLKIKETLKN